MDQDDLDRIAKCNDGDMEACAALYEQYKLLVFHTALLIVGDREDAEDILQDVFMAVFRSLSTYDPAKGAFSTWIHQITVNRCLNYKRGENAFRWLGVRLGLMGNPVRSPYLIAENRDWMRQALYRLNKPLRAVLVLRYYHNLSYQEIAQILRISLGTVKSRLYQAHKCLEKMLVVEGCYEPENSEGLP